MSQDRLQLIRLPSAREDERREAEERQRRIARRAEALACSGWEPTADEEEEIRRARALLQRTRAQ